MSLIGTCLSFSVSQCQHIICSNVLHLMSLCQYSHHFVQMSFFFCLCLSMSKYIQISLVLCLALNIYIRKNIYICLSASLFMSIYVHAYVSLSLSLSSTVFINVQMSSLLYSVSMSTSMKANTFLSSWSLYVHTVRMSLFLSVSLWQFPGCPRLGYSCCCLPFLLCLPPHPTTHSSFYTPATPSTLQLPIYGLHPLPPFPPPPSSLRPSFYN